MLATLGLSASMGVVNWFTWHDTHTPDHFAVQFEQSAPVNDGPMTTVSGQMGGKTVHFAVEGAPISAFVYDLALQNQDHPSNLLVLQTAEGASKGGAVYAYYATRGRLTQLHIAAWIGVPVHFDQGQNTLSFQTFDNDARILAVSYKLNLVSGRFSLVSRKRIKD
jgi:hypothetical protein